MDDMPQKITHYKITPDEAKRLDSEEVVFVTDDGKLAFYGKNATPSDARKFADTNPASMDFTELTKTPLVWSQFNVALVQHPSVSDGDIVDITEPEGMFVRADDGDFGAEVPFESDWEVEECDDFHEYTLIFETEKDISDKRSWSHSDNKSHVHADSIELVMK